MSDDPRLPRRDAGQRLEARHEPGEAALGAQRDLELGVVGTRARRGAQEET